MTTRFVKISACGLAAAGLVGCAFGQIAKTKDGKYSFRTRYAPGMTIRYETLAGQADQSGNLTGPTISTPMIIRVIDNKGGHATVEMSTGPGTSGGQQVFGKSTIKMPMDNKNSSVGGMSVALPVKPIGIGAEWHAIMPLKVGGGAPTKLDAQYKFLGLKQISGANVAIIAYNMSGTAEGSGTMYLRTSDGTLESTEMNLRLTAGATLTTRVHMSIKRKPDAVKPARKKH